MRQKMLCFILGVIGSFNLTAQSKLFLEASTEFNFSSFNYEWEGDLNTSYTDSFSERFNYNFAIGIPVYEKIQMKVAGGIFHAEAKAITVEWERNNVNAYYFGSEKMRFAYVELLPEVRFFPEKWLFVNAGIGIGSVQADEGEGNYLLFSGNRESGDLNFFEVYETKTYFAANVGAAYFYKNIGLLGQIGFRHLPKAAPNEEVLPMVGVQQLVFKVGLTYAFDL